jgi:4-hydroxy-tetrahydrodipicolinate reductase
MIEVVVCGAGGRMGQEVLRAVAGQPDMRVVAAVDPGLEGVTVNDGLGGQIPVSADLPSALKGSGPDVVVDFTRPDTVASNARTALKAGVDCVVGTTGLAEAQLEELAGQAADGATLFVAPNFAIGAVLMMRFAAEAARYMPHAEVVELHHDRKLDAPSGTAMRTAALIGDARDAVPATPGAETEVEAGARGATVDGVPVHSIRLPGLVAHQAVIFGGMGQTLTLRHDTIDRTSFMPGVVLAIRKVGDLDSGLVVGLEHLLDD